MIRGKITMVAAAQETMMTSAHMAKKIIRVSRYGLPCTTLRLTIQRAIYSVIPAALMMLVKAKKKNSSRTVELPKPSLRTAGTVE